MNLFNLLETYTWKYDTNNGFSYQKGNSFEDFANNYGSELYSIFKFVSFLIIVAAIVIIFYYRKQHNAPSLTVKAKIVDMIPSRSPGTVLDSITFEFDNGERKTLYINGCQMYNIGDEGELVYKNSYIINFKVK